MKVYVVKTDDSKELYFSSLRKARRYNNDIKIIKIDIDYLPHDGCTWSDIELWSDLVDSWIID